MYGDDMRRFKYSLTSFVESCNEFMNRKTPGQIISETMEAHRKEYEKMFGDLSSDSGGNIPVGKVSSSDGKEYTFICDELLCEDGKVSSSHSLYADGKVSSSHSLYADGKEYFVMDGPYDKIVKELRDTYIAKNSDYGNSFEKSIDEFGVISAIVRMSDKMERLKSLTVNNTLYKKPMVDESLIDTTKDLANYAIMLAMYLEEDDNNDD